MNHNNINILKNNINTKVSNFVLLSIVTGGIYPMMWLYLNQTKITEETKMNLLLKTIHYGLQSLRGLAGYYQTLV